MPDLTLRSKTYSEIGRRFEGTDHDAQTLDIRDLNTNKANKDEMATALGQKADTSTVNDALATKADALATEQALATKADAISTAQALNTKATVTQLEEASNEAFINSLLF
jgi:hypothetical protein